MNILYHHRTMARGAEGVHITSVVKALREMGHTVDIVSPPGVDPFAEIGAAPVDKSNVKTSGIQSLWKFISKRFPNFAFELAEIGYNFSALPRLRAALRQKSYDVMYERYAFYLCAGVLAAEEYRIPIVLEANEVSGVRRARRQSFPRLCRYFERWIFRRARGILTVSSFLKRCIEAHGVMAKRVMVVPNAIDPKSIAFSDKDSTLVDQLGLRNRLVLGFAGWFDQWDRLDLFIDALHALKARHSELMVLLIGDGPVLQLIRQKVADLGLHNDVVFTGPIKRHDMPRYLRLIDIAVLPHSNEFGSPVILFEFMALKIPVVAPSLAPITDVLVNDETGFLFVPLDIRACADAIERAVVDATRRRRVGDNAYAQVLARHTWHQNAQKIFTVAELHA